MNDGGTFAEADVKTNPDGVIEWVTPDDVTVRFDPAGIGARLGAVIFDAVLIILLLIGLYVLATLAWVFTMSGAPLILFLLTAFFLRIGYWIWYEWRSMGQTYGKSLAGIQVLRADGGSLTLSAVVTRNLLREVEFWIPLSILLMLVSGTAGQPLLLWCLGFLLIPLFSGSNRRLGDFVAGTVVVESPGDVTLNRDLLDRSNPRHQKSSYAFTRDMLDVYGVVQLNALQDVLETQLYERTHNTSGHQPETLHEIKDRVVDKIGYPHPVPDAEAVPFLQEFYRAMRRHLEGKLASGQAIRTEIKEDTDSRASSRLVDRLAEKYRLPERGGERDS